MPGRFPITHEIAHIHRMMREELQRQVGTIVLWFAYRAEGTVVHDIYDVGIGRDWAPSVPLPVISAVREEGPEQIGQPAFYSTDHVHLVISYADWRAAGLTDPQRIDNHLHARFVYDDVVFEVIAMQIRGQLQERDVVIGIDAREVDPAELVNDPDFQSWATA